MRLKIHNHRLFYYQLSFSLVGLVLFYVLDIRLSLPLSLITPSFIYYLTAGNVVTTRIGSLENILSELQSLAKKQPLKGDDLQRVKELMAMLKS